MPPSRRRDMNNTIFMLDLCKKEYKLITQEVKKLQKLDPISLSNALKREAIPKLKLEREKLKQEYNAMLPSAQAWISEFFSAKEKEILLRYYYNIQTTDLQATINIVCKPRLIKENKKVIDENPFMYASNIRQSVVTAWLRELKA